MVRRRGLAAWMRAAGAVHQSGVRPPSPWASRPLRAVPEIAAPEMVTILTQMVLATGPEVRR